MQKYDIGWWACVALWAGAALCATSCAGKGSGCVEGQSTACVCTDGREGAQICGGDDSYDECVCKGGAPEEPGDRRSDDTASSPDPDDDAPRRPKEQSRPDPMDEDPMDEDPMDEDPMDEDPRDNPRDENETGSSDGGQPPTPEEDSESQARLENGHGTSSSEDEGQSILVEEVDSTPSFNPRVDCPLFPTSIAWDTTIAPGCYRIAATPSFADHVTLTISPEVTMYVDPGVWIEIPEDVELRAFGVESRPIVWQGIEEKRGSWGGIYVVGRALLDYVEIRHGGGSIPVASARAKAGLSVDGELLMANTLLSENAGYGLRYEPGDTTQELPLLGGNTITGNEASVRVNVWHRGQLLPGLSLRDNDDDTLDVSLEPSLRIYTAASDPERTIAANYVSGVGGVAWQDLGVPNRMLGGLVVTGWLRLSAGIELRFPAGTGVVVARPLIAEGTADTPVWLTADEEDKPWYGIVSCGNGSADLTGTEITGAEANASFVATACKSHVSEVAAGIQIIP